MHVDDFIDRFTPISEFASDEAREAERYARWVLMLLRLPAALAIDFREYIPPLFCSHDGKRYRVVFASRMGWIGLTKDPNGETYQESVGADECCDWSGKR